MLALEKNLNLSWNKVGTFTVIIDSETHQEIHHLNEVGAFLGENINGKNSKDDLISILTNEFEVDVKKAEVDITYFIETLKEKSLIN